MIKTVEVGNFLSHSSTSIDFEKGVTVFVGENGAGKSSIIDAITFALFGQHTRKSNKGLIRRGTNQAFTKIIFSINDRNFEAIRKIDAKGTTSAEFLEQKNGKLIPIAIGERKQFGESMTKQIESFIGLNFEKLKVASIVQQGELNSIIKAKPKEFKELLNSVIGIDRLDIASENIKEVQKQFRNHIKGKIEYDDTDFEVLKNELITTGTEIKKSQILKEKIEKEKTKQEEFFEKTRQKIEKDRSKEILLDELETRKLDLIKYAKEAIIAIQKNILENEKKVDACSDCFEFVTKKQKIENEFEKIQTSLENTINKIQECSKREASLNEQILLAKKLQLKNKKCPVCDSEVDHLNPIFQVEHLKNELEKIGNELNTLETQKVFFNKSKIDLSKKIQKATDAESILRAHSIKDKNEIEIIKQEIKEKKNIVKKIPALQNNSGKLIEIALIDSHAKSIYDKIVELESTTKGFDKDEFYKLKESFEVKRDEISKLDQQYGGIIEKIKNHTERTKHIKSVIDEIEFVQRYMHQLESIHTNVFNRDGSVAISLRSWALNAISSKASDYLTMFNTKIHRIFLSEKTRDVSITCYSKNSELDIESLSGGEQVSIALALRLGIASLLGSSNLNFVILDEPTTHLDEERRRSLVNVLSQLSDITNTNSRTPMQFIIITHDVEIFENANIDSVYKFSSSPNGTQVASL